MSTLKADAVTSAQDNTALTLSGTGTGGVKVNDFFVQTKGSDVASDTALTLGKDGNLFDVTGTTTITSIATQGIGSLVTLHFDGALTFTHHSTNLILPGAASITTAAGDIAVMYEYASADWRCVSYTKASGAAVVAGGLATPANFVSADQTVGTDAALEIAHSLGVVPVLWTISLVCTSAEHGFAIDDEIYMSSRHSYAEASKGITAYANATNIVVVQGSAPLKAFIADDDFNDTDLTTSSWRWVARAWS
jgi:hypothetical protein